MVYQLRDNYYIHTAYANASDGSIDFSVSDSEERAFVGHVSNSTASEITDPSAYEWVAIDEDAEPEDETSDGIDTLIDLLDTDGDSTGNAAGGAQDSADDVREIVSEVTTNENGQTVIDGGKIKTGSVTATQIDVNDLFAQNITATGTISGLKLRGEEIDIESDADNGVVCKIKTEADGQYSALNLRTTGDDGESLMWISQNYAFIHSRNSDHSAIARTIADRIITETQAESAHIEIYDVPDPHWPGHYTGEIDVTADKITINGKEYGSEESYTYTSFLSSVVSGTVLVSKKNGIAMLSANITLSGALASQTTILSGLPATQHGYWIYTNVPATNSTSVKPLTVRIGADGDLQAHYGGAGSYVFQLVYPVS